MHYMLQPVSQHRVFTFFLLSQLWLAIGCLISSFINETPITNFIFVLLLMATITMIYTCLWVAIKEKILSYFLIFEFTPLLTHHQKYTIRGLVVLYGTIVSLHFLFLGYIPIIEALKSTTDVDVSIVRQQGYFDLPLFLRYASDYSVKAFGPALLLITYHFRLRLFWVVLGIGCLYSVALFVRVLPIIFLIPLIVYSALNRRWLHVIATTILLVLILGLVTSTSSILLRQNYSDISKKETKLSQELTTIKASLLSDQDESSNQDQNKAFTKISIFIAQESQYLDQGITLSKKNIDELHAILKILDQQVYFISDDTVLAKNRELSLQTADFLEKQILLTDKLSDWRRTSSMYAIAERSLIVPGTVISQWFFYYENSQSREQGCGYRLLAEILGCDYVHIPHKLYATFYPDNVRKGMQGSLNAAWFMTDYANFGLVGVAISSFFAAVLFIIIMLIYGTHPLALPMNLALIIAAMESNLITAINSGSGWLITTAIFLLFFRLKGR